MCTVLLPPGDNPIAVDKYIISYNNQMGRTLKKSWCTKTKQYPIMSLRTVKNYINLRITGLGAQNRLQDLVNTKRELIPRRRTTWRREVHSTVRICIEIMKTRVFWNVVEGYQRYWWTWQFPPKRCRLPNCTESCTSHHFVNFKTTREVLIHAGTEWGFLCIQRVQEPVDSVLLPLVQHSTIFVYFSLKQREVRKWHAIVKWPPVITASYHVNSTRLLQARQYDVSTVFAKF